MTTGFQAKPTSINVDRNNKKYYFLWILFFGDPKEGSQEHLVLRIVFGPFGTFTNIITTIVYMEH